MVDDMSIFRAVIHLFAEPGVSFLVHKTLLHTPPDDPEFVSARQQAYENGPISKILNAMNKEGYWEKPGPGYTPKYRSGVWSLLTLAQLGASIHEDPRLETACEYMMQQALSPSGQFSFNGKISGTFDCLQGNLCWALMTLGVQPERLLSAFTWMARTVTGDGMGALGDKTTAQRYYVYKCGPTFRCGANDKLPCAWGGVKVMLAFGALPQEYWSPVITGAVQAGAEFLLRVDPSTGNYPTWDGRPPSGNWWKFGFPVFYITDLLQLAEALATTGYAQDNRLVKTIQLIRGKQQPNGVWLMENNYSGKVWSDFGRKRTPNPWVTIRALRVLHLLDQAIV